MARIVAARGRRAEYVRERVGAPQLPPRVMDETAKHEARLPADAMGK